MGVLALVDGEVSAVGARLRHARQGRSRRSSAMNPTAIIVRAFQTKLFPLLVSTFGGSGESAVGIVVSLDCSTSSHLSRRSYPFHSDTTNLNVPFTPGVVLLSNAIGISALPLFKSLGSIFVVACFAPRFCQEYFTLQESPVASG